MPVRMVFKTLSKYLLSIILFLYLSSSALAQSSLIPLVINQLGLDSSDCYLNFISIKQFPNSNNKSIVVIPKIVNIDEESLSLDSYIIVIETSSGNIQSTYFESNRTNEWYSDAVQMESISIDSTAYILNRKNTAFGIRVNYSGPSRVNPSHEEFISLFVQEGDSLKRVLRRYPIEKFLGEWDGMCEGEFVEKNGNIRFENEMTNGYNNLNIKTQIKTTVRSKFEKDCRDKESLDYSDTTLIFNGVNYE